MKRQVIIALWCLGGVLMGNDFDFPQDASVKVMYQTKTNSSWTTSNTTLQGIVSESMAINQIAAKNPHAKVRILGMEYRMKKYFQARYQYRNYRGGTWMTGTTSLLNTLTESMAVNQLSAKYPGYEIRILSLIEK